MGAHGRRAPAVLLALAALAAAAPAAHAESADTGHVVRLLGELDHKLNGLSSLSSAERSVVHRDKAQLISDSYGDKANGITYAELLNDLDCVDTSLQLARNASRKSAQKSWVKQSKACQARLASALGAGGQASGALTADVKRLGSAIGAVATRVRQGRVFGSKTRAVRDRAAAIVGSHFTGKQYGVALSEHFRDLECIDVKAESGRISGASSCARRLARLIKANAPAKPSVTFGSDLTGDPVALPGVWREDSEFWTTGLTVPAAGTVTEFRLRTGADPVSLPVRFSVVRPQPDGRVKVITTTDPPYLVPGGTPGIYTVKSSTFSFRCCRVLQGDIVTVDNRGAEETESPYVWFARKPGFTAFSHMEPGVSQDAGQLWRPDPHVGFDVLLQVVMTPD